MDHTTLEWIAAHRPLLATSPPAVPAAVQNVGGWPGFLVPDDRWFAVPDAPDSLHGVRHAARVSVLAGLLAAQHHLTPAQTTALGLAAAVHDCRRRDDRADFGHGQRASRWLRYHHTRVAGHLGLKVSGEDLAQALTAISLHDVPHADFSTFQHLRYRQARLLTDLLKAADALDRYRLPLERWWPDPSLIRLPVPPWLHQVAFDLMLHSERARLDGSTNHAALTHAHRLVYEQPGGGTP